ncbi:hypothetical protein CAP36_05040 [Chitinophagaceae bacterium IBVUCB2]|nr:hypothetical protein CAP36_05040 [Chitinophagaceae bacterium IBVUCB2]
MKKYTLWLLISGLMFGQKANGQDYIINWQNDTIICKLPGNIKKTGLKPAWKYEDGYEKIVTVFGYDSVRIIKAGEVKGYSRKEHGKKLLCDGFFESKQIVTAGQKRRTNVEESGASDNEDWIFLSRLIEGKYATLYIRYASDGRGIYTSYYLHRQGIEKENTVIPFFNKKKMLELLSNSASQLKDFKYRKSNKGFQEIVHEYNRLKEMAAIK